jgi:hypothetical protein
MVLGVHAEAMNGGILVLVFLLVIGPLALLYGVDSRPIEDRERRGWWPGAPRRRR